MSHPPQPSDGELEELLNTDRDLTGAERRTLRALAAAGWEQLSSLLTQRSREAYDAADPQAFGKCVTAHLDIVQIRELICADAYHCPQCGQLLKDRRTPVASTILLERRRMAGLWKAVEEAGNDEQRRMAMHRFRTGMGLSS